MLHSCSPHVCALENWATRRSWGKIGPRSFRAFVLPVMGWVLAQWAQARASEQQENSARAWADAKQGRDIYASTHGGYNSSGFAIPGAVAAAARGL